MTSKLALLVLDMQNEMVHPQGKIGASGYATIIEDRKVIPNVRKVVDAMRKADNHVVFVRVGFRGDYLDTLSRAARVDKLKQSGALQVGSWGLEFPAELAPLESEMIFTKQAVNPFFNTGLQTWLFRQGVETVALCGGFTHLVVDSTARYADDSGFRVIILEDCCASPDPELHRIEMEKILPTFGSVMSSDEFISDFSES